ncbi:MAG: 30S ribosomal protein S8 [bacterium]|nr:30S ribosomal protein S8 [bacterium]
MDPIANMVTALKNASLSKKSEARLPYATFTHQIANLLLKEGYVEDVSVEGDGVRKKLVITLKFVQTGAAKNAKEGRISEVKRVSKPSRRMYAGYREIRSVRQGRGIALISTPAGLKTDKEARKEKLGGELLFEIW